MKKIVLDKKSKIVPKNPIGRPEKYNAQFHPLIVKVLAEQGLIESEIQKKIDISVATFVSWKKKYPEFLKALTEGKYATDKEVERALLKRAKGYEYDESVEEPVSSKVDGKPTKKLAVTKVMHKHMAGDVGAQTLWLKNRMPDKWRDKQDITMNATISEAVDMSPEERHQWMIDNGFIKI